MNKQKSITLIGCGWFGFPFAKAMVAAGYQVHANKRDSVEADNLQQWGIHGFQLDLADVYTDASLETHLDTDILVINIPPGLRRGENQYLYNLNALKALIGHRQYQKVVFVSTTGVYPSLNQIMTEQDAAVYNDSSDILLQAEAMFSGFESSCIVRFAGLVGPKRHPGRFFAGREDVSGGNVAVNLVHLDDCIAAIKCIVESESCSDTYNLCASLHPRRDDFYSKACQHLNMPLPQFNGDEQDSKAIDGQLICRELGYQYRYDDPIKMLDAC
ncbi:SDR family oxidoreductase [Shewanella maritima]|uniref:SDR family oxidoreductase n=1 Tax=Shewanella maritima TaxID=2520507 RepID=UPI003736C112